MSKTARQVALTLLERCRRGGAFADSMLRQLPEVAELNTKDRALAAKLCYGVLQNTILCDYYIDSFVRNKKIEPKVRDILRLSVYQILFLDKVPSHAAVNEGVELCKSYGIRRASGFVNAVLRKFAQNKNNLPSIPKNNRTEYLSIKYSHPIFLTSLFVSNFGEEMTELILKSNNMPVSTYIQVNTIKTNAETLWKQLNDHGFECRHHEFLVNCLEISSGNLMAADEFNDGLFYVQDPAARLAVEAASPKKGDTILDACSAPGGKSFAAAIMMDNTGSIFSSDIHSNKLKLISEGADRLGIRIISVFEMDAQNQKKSLFNTFDVVFADVPCSGLGVIRKKPDIRYKNTAILESFPPKQLKILSSLSNYVKPGGILLYSTCTILKSENEDVIKSFLSEHKDYYSEGFTFPAPIGDIHTGMLTLYPHMHGTDGFFICRLRRKNVN